MKKSIITFLLLTSLICLVRNTFAQCNSNEYTINIEISPDAYFYETTWKIFDNIGNVVAFDSITNGNPYNQTICLPNQASCYNFTIYDSYGDGIYSPGYYRLRVDGVQVANGAAFGTQESTFFGCAPGTSCSSPFPATEGQWTAPNPETWYVFTADSSGNYEFSTCGLSTNCNTAIWIYDACTGILITETVMGATFFANSGCSSGTGANLTAAMIAGQQYFIRIGDDAFNSCAGLPINWNLSYLGPIVGCMDSTACNFNPLATVSDNNCIYQGNPNCRSHDLKVDSAALVNSFFLNSYTADPCSVTEGCVTGYGNREVISFTMRIDNIGSEDYYIGAPPANVNTPSNVFEYSNCHGHWHYKHYGKYTVFDINGNEIPVGLKNGFCVIDLACSTGATPQYGCGNMGISAGCADIYGAGTTCQWIDATDLDTGFYYFIAEVNWLQQPDALGRIEETYSNNRVALCFHLSRNAAGQAQVNVIPNCVPFSDCNGVLMGPARPDCEGTCNGFKLSGDLDLDTVRTFVDVDQYLRESVLDTISILKCTDLNADTAVNVVDAALLQECVIHGPDTSYWNHNTGCIFPFGIYNPNQMVILNMGRAVSSLNYVEVDILNPFNRVMAFEFKVNGLSQIDSVVSLIPGFNPLIRFGQDGQIVGLDSSENYIERKYNPTPFIRIYYSGVDSNNICIGEITAFVNDVYEETDKYIGNNCATFMPSSTVQQQTLMPKISAVPNPFDSKTTIYIDQADDSPFELYVTDIMGQKIAEFQNVLTNQVELDREGWSSGVYFVHLNRAGKIIITKIIAK